jgi:hypothetical protein
MVPYQIPGVQLVVSRKGKVLLDRAFGYSNHAQGITASTSKMHRIASVSKVITKLAVEKLIRKSYLSRSSLVFVDIFGKEFNTILNPKADLITVGHLIDHKVGVWPTTTR